MTCQIFTKNIEKIIQTAKAKNPDVIVMVDNCYGEFVQKREPIEVGADLIAGSMIKNAGGGIARAQYRMRDGIMTAVRLLSFMQERGLDVAGLNARF